MKKLNVLFLIIFVPIVLQGQNIPQGFSLTHDSDTSYWANQQSKCLNNLKQIKSFDKNQNYHFRMVYHGPLISKMMDLWQDDDSSYHVEIVLFSKEIVPADEEPTNRYYSEKYSFDTLKAMEVLNVISNFQIELIPSDKKILGWSWGFDGDELVIEVLKNKSYSFKQYWMPSIQHSSHEAVIIDSFYNRLINLLEIAKLEKDFKLRIPFECYNSAGPQAICKPLTKKERKNYIRERKNYRQQSVSPMP